MCNVINTHLLIFAMIYKNVMRKLLYFFSVCFLLTNCNDGDIITVDIDFEDTFNYCGELVFYKTKDDPSESLTLKLDTTIEDLIELDDDNMLVNTSESFELSSSSNSFNYRSYGSNLPSLYFCEAITPNIPIISDSESETGTVIVTTVLTEDDNDDIPTEIEDKNLDDDDDPSTNPTDTDSDGIPDYLDDDDDGDNVPTKSEDHNYSTTTGFTDALDTDDDGIPNYLDTDDDGDGVLTRDEENDTPDQNPTNDIYDNNVGADYLNSQYSEVVTATAFRVHTIKQTFKITTEVNGFSFPNLTQTNLNFGTLTLNSSEPCPCERTLTPEFN